MKVLICFAALVANLALAQEIPQKQFSLLEQQLEQDLQIPPTGTYGPAELEEKDGGDKRLFRKRHLLDAIRNSQQKADQAFFPRKMYPPIKWQKQRGIYDSFVHLNVHGKFPLMTSIRRGYNFPDDNAFVTMFIAHSLIEIARLDPGLLISDAEITRAIRAINTHRDKNSPEGLPLYSFWNQEKTALDNFRAVPPNINIPLKEAHDGLSMIRKGLEKFHLPYDTLKSILDSVVSLTGSFQYIFSIPPDSDDTGCNMALGMELLSVPDSIGLFEHFRNAKRAWKNNNFVNETKIFDFYFRYAYRPFSSKYEQKAIDPRTYYWINTFVEQEYKIGRTQLRLITTWMQSISELQSQKDYQKMPFAVNNVDISVTANSLFGMALFFRRVDAPLMSTDIGSMFLDNIRLLEHVIVNDIVEDYGPWTLLYYPSKYSFYWFVARLVQALDYEFLDDSPNVGFIRAARNILRPVAETKVTQLLFKSMECDDKRRCYWDDFLGNGDYFGNKTKAMHEDRVFSTATVFNALLDIWSLKTHAEDRDHLVWKDNIPSEVKLIIDSVRKWIVEESENFPKMNASVRSGYSTPFFFPQNDFRLINGTSLGDCSQYKNASDLAAVGGTYNVVASVAGYIPVDKYQKMLNNFECLGQKFDRTKVDVDLNCPGCTFPFWSSNALTNAMELLALTKYDEVVDPSRGGGDST